MSKNQISAILMLFEDNFKYLVPDQTHREGGDLLVVGYGHGVGNGEGNFPPNFGRGPEIKKMY